MNSSNNIDSNPFAAYNEGLGNPGFVDIELESTDAPTSDHVASLIEVPQTANTFGEVLRQAGIPVENELDPESRLNIEQAFQSVHFNEAEGYTLIPKGPPCHQTFTLSPINMRIEDSANRKMKCTSGWGCFCCFLPSCLLGFQKMTLKQGDQEVLSFSYRPRVWSFCQRKHLKVDIFVPHQSESIGSVICGKTQEEKTVIIDRVSQSVFFAIKSTYNFIGLKLPRLVIRNSIGTFVTSAEAFTGGLRYTEMKNFTDYDFMFSHDASINSASARAVLTVGIALWVLERRESTGRGLWIFFLIVIAIFIMMVMADFF